MTFLETDRLEVITGVNLPMLIKLASSALDRQDLLAVAHEMRDHGRNAIWVASDLLRGEKAVSIRRRPTPHRTHDVARCDVVNQLGMHARAAAKFVHLATRFEARVRVARDGREMDGKSIMGILLLAAARGIDHHDLRRRRGRAGGGRRRWWRWCESRIRRGRMQRLTGIGVSPGVVVRPRRHPDPARAGAALPDCAGVASTHELARLDESRAAIAPAAARHPRARRAARGPELASLFDAQLLMLDDPMLVPRAAEIVREQRVNAEWAVQQVFHEFSAVFDEVADPYLRERKGDVADLVGRLRDEPAAGRGDAARPAARARRGVGADRRRADAVARRAGRLDEGARLRDRRRQPHRTTPRSWRVRSRCRRSSACTTPARVVQAGQLVVIDGTRNEVIVDPDDETLARVARQRGRPSAAARASTPNAGGRRRPPTASASGSTRTSSSPTISRRRAMPAPKASACTDRSSCCTGDAAASPTRTRSTEIYRGMLEGMAPGTGDGAHVRRRRGSAGAAGRAIRSVGGGWSAEEERGSRQGLRGLRLSLTRPGAVPRPAARAAARGAARIAADHVSVRVGRRAGARGAADGRRGGGRSRAARRAGAATCRSA